MRALGDIDRLARTGIVMDHAILKLGQAFQVAALPGLTVCCAAGDNGSSDGANDATCDGPSIRRISRGGVSRLFPDSGPATGYQIRVDGRDAVFRGYECSGAAVGR